jgi:4-aminobutyrate aminotransferase / (S)-3-amino-2-methylpropionate transaminase / 5-aminovalerate transaminase
MSAGFISLKISASEEDAAAESPELRRIDRDCMSWGDTVHYVESPLIVTACQDDTVEDDAGNWYIDTGMWHSSCNFGYRNRAIEDAVAAQLQTLPQVCGDYLHREKLLLAREVVEAIEERTGVRGRVSFNVGGSLAVEDALKIVRKHTGRNRVAVMMGSYHGRSLGTLSLSSSHRYRQHYNEFADRAIMFPFADCTQCYYEKSPDTCETYCGRMIRKAFANEYYGLATDDSTEIGGVFIEPCQGRGYTVPPRDFYNEFLDEARRRGILIVSDEIQVGMFRTGKLFAFEHFGFVPDIITLSKSLTNGLSPLSLVWARADLLDREVFTPGHTHSNFANHPLGTAAGLAAWRYMTSRDYEVSVPRKGGRYLEGLRLLKERYPFIHSVDGLGLLLNMVFADANGKPHKGMARLATDIAQRQDFTWEGTRWRMLLQVGGPENNVLKFAPYLDITEEEIERSVGVLDQVLARLASEPGQ